MFEAALDLPCTAGGEGGCAEERPEALLEIARSQASLGEVRLGLVAVAGLLEVAPGGGGEELAAELRADPALKALQASPKFEGLLKMYAEAGGDGGGVSGAPDSAMMGTRSFTQVDTSSMSPLEKALRGEWMWNLLTKKRDWSLVEFGDEVDAQDEQR